MKCRCGRHELENQRRPWRFDGEAHTHFKCGPYSRAIERVHEPESLMTIRWAGGGSSTVGGIDSADAMIDYAKGAIEALRGEAQGQAMTDLETLLQLFAQRGIKHSVRHSGADGTQLVAGDFDEVDGTTYTGKPFRSLAGQYAELGFNAAGELSSVIGWER